MSDRRIPAQSPIALPSAVDDPAWQQLKEDYHRQYERANVAEAALLAARADAGLRRSLRDDALCVSQWFEDAWTGDENEPVYQAAVRLRAALAATPEGTDHG